MALSDQLARLSARAKQLEDHAAAAKAKAKADLQQDVKSARESAQEQADALRTTANQTKAEVSSWWHNVGNAWAEHTSNIRHDIDDKRAAHDLKAAQRAADQAESDAAYAVDYAYAAVEEAEYAVLDAALSRMEADELAND